MWKSVLSSLLQGIQFSSWQFTRCTGSNPGSLDFLHTCQCPSYHHGNSLRRQPVVYPDSQRHLRVGWWDVSGSDTGLPVRAVDAAIINDHYGNYPAAAYYAWPLWYSYDAGLPPPPTLEHVGYLFDWYSGCHYQIEGFQHNISPTRTLAHFCSNASSSMCHTILAHGTLVAVL